MVIEYFIGRRPTLKIATQTVTSTKEGDVRNRKKGGDRGPCGPNISPAIIKVVIRAECALQEKREVVINILDKPSRKLGGRRDRLRYHGSKKVRYLLVYRVIRDG